MNSKMFIRCCLCAFIMAAYQGFCQDIIMKCPATWYEGQTVTLSCEVNNNQWQYPSPCSSAYSETVEFKFTNNAQTTEASERKISNVKTNCSSTPNANGCWCSFNGTFYFLYCNITANKARYDGGSWKCQPECSGSGTVMRPLLTRECTYTAFYDVCAGNPCSPGNCSVVNNQRFCSCSGTLYTGDACKEILCPKNLKENCCLNRTTTNGTDDWTKVTCPAYSSEQVSLLEALHQKDLEEKKLQLGLGLGLGLGITIVIIIGLLIGLVYCCRCCRRNIPVETADTNEVQKNLNIFGFDKHAKITSTSVTITHKNYWNLNFIETTVRDMIKNIQKKSSNG